jgi:hypothetical protein
LPLSVREWYSFESAVAALAEHSNQDPPIAIRDFAVLEWNSHRLLPIRRENQGVCTWAIDLDGSEDPPVLVDVDSDGKEWHLLAPRFSSYVYSCIWDYRKVFGRAAIVQAQNGVLSRGALAVLSTKFAAELQTYGWPGSTQYRFDGGDAAILIWSSADQADWFIAASSAGRLKRTVADLWLLDGIGAALYGCSAIGEAVLRELRATA